MSSENILWLNLHRLKWKGGYVAVKSPNLRMFNLLNLKFMIRRIVAVVGLMVNFVIYSQHPSNSENVLTVPIASPTTPTTNQMERFGNISINESTGTLNHSIKLFDYYTGNDYIPIQLSYIGNGVKVNQEPSWVGINWNFEPLGLITRVVKDRQDESCADSNRIYLSKQELDNLPGFGNCSDNTWFNNIKAICEYNDVDSEVDIFTYNFMGYHGSFYLDKFNNVHIIKYDKEIKILFNYQPNNTSNITIYTPDGNVYFFGGPYASESSRIVSNNNMYVNANIEFSQNAFYLYQMTYYNGISVFFDYDVNTQECHYKIGEEELGSYAILYYPFSNNKTRLENEIQRKVSLDTIRNSINDQIIVFEKENWGECNSVNKLNNIYLKNNDSILKRIKLNYAVIDKEEVYTHNKFFLEDIEFYGKEDAFVNKYHFNYNNLELLPSKNSYARDHLDFYNGANNNNTLLPQLDFSFPIDGSFNFANREAEYYYSLCGSLHSIEYPTGGLSYFEYELPVKGYIPSTDHDYTTIYYNDPTRNYESYPSNPTLLPDGMIEYKGVINPDMGDGPLILTSESNIKAKVMLSQKGCFTQHNKIKFTIKRRDNAESEFAIYKDFNYSLENVSGCSDFIYFTYNEDEDLQPGEYIFEISILLHQSSYNANHSVIVSLNLTLPNESQPIPVYYPGLRIKKIINYKKSYSPNPEITRYYYNKITDIHIESFSYYPLYHFMTNKYIGNHLYSDLLNINSNSIKNVFNSSTSNFIYPYVTVSYGGDNFEKGGKELHFKGNTPDGLPNFYFFPNQILCTLNIPSNLNYGDFILYSNVRTNNSIENSTLLGETLFDSKLSEVKKTVYNYGQNMKSLAHNINVVNYGDPEGLGGIGIPKLSNSLLLYETKSYDYFLTSIYTEDFFPSGKIENLKTFTYQNNIVSLPNTIEETTSSNNTILTTIYYPFDIIIPDLSPSDSQNITIMKSRNKLNQIIRKEEMVNGNLISLEQFSFGNFSGLILPSLYKKAKGNNALETTMGFDYNFYGKPIRIINNNTNVTKYVYNTKLQITQKREFVGTELVDDSVSPQDNCLYQKMFPNSMVTDYEYDPLTMSLTKIKNPNCDTQYYSYDSFNRLQYVKDKNGNILSKNEYHYRP